MTTFKQKVWAISIVVGSLALQGGLIVASSSANATQETNTYKAPKTKSVSLSWVEAQQAKYQQGNTDLNNEQENKLVTVMRLMTLDL